MTVRLCSPRLRDLIDAVSSELDEYQWLDAAIVTPEERVTYFILHFPRLADVLDESATTRSRTGSLVRPVISNARAEGRRIFGLSYRLRTVVDQVMHDAVVESGCTGLEFAPLRGVV